MKYSDLVSVYECIESTSKRLEKTNFIFELLKKTKENDIKNIILLLRGRLFPEWDKRKIGVASRLVLKAISIASGTSTNKIEKKWKEIGDLGLVAEKLITNKSQSTLFSKKLTVEKVLLNLRKLSSTEGSGSVNRKTQLIAELLTSAKPKEAKYVIRTVLEDLRVGIGDGTLRDSIIWTFMPVKVEFDSETISIDVDRDEYNKTIELVQSAIDKSNDFGMVAEIARKGVSELKKVNLVIGNPVKVMLAQKVKNIDEGFEKVGSPAEIEYKYDGFRMQIHKSKENTTIFTRRLENVTEQFPEVLEAVKNNVKSDSFIIDCEAVGFNPKTKKYMPFQNISQRIRRKYDIKKLSKELPVELNVFDVLFLDDKSIIKKTFKERRKLLEKLIKEEKRKIMIAKNLKTSNRKKALLFYKESLKKGNEGVILKSSDGVYKPGSRVGFMVKLKPSMNTFDLTIIGAEWGKGKRSGWLTSFSLACFDEGRFLPIGKVGTGIKEKAKQGTSFKELTELLKPHIIKEDGREASIKPEIVIEIRFEEIQKSTNYSSGFALRFPRFVRIRDDRSPEECSSFEMIKEAFKKQ